LTISKTTGLRILLPNSCTKVVRAVERISQGLFIFQAPLRHGESRGAKPLWREFEGVPQNSNPPSPDIGRRGIKGDEAKALPDHRDF